VPVVSAFLSSYFKTQAPFSFVSLPEAISLGLFSSLFSVSVLLLKEVSPPPPKRIISSF